VHSSPTSLQGFFRQIRILDSPFPSLALRVRITWRGKKREKSEKKQKRKRREIIKQVKRKKQKRKATKRKEKRKME
jgi:hypothetical protein